MTWYPQSYLRKAPMTNMAMRANPARGYPGRTYRFYKGPVVFPFGHGLGYSNFAHSLVQAPTTVSVSLAALQGVRNSTMGIGDGAVRLNHANCNTQQALSFQVDVKNTGSMDGSHTLLLFSTPPPGTSYSPIKRLLAFEKVEVGAGSEARVRFELHVCKHLSVVDHYGIHRIPMGDHQFHIGHLQHSVSLQATLEQIKS